MSIKSIQILNVMAFQGQCRKNNGDPKEGEIKAGDVISEAFELEFSDGINVLIGENGTGKTTLLKMIYAATQWSIEKNEPGKTDRFYRFFSSNLSDTDLLRNGSHLDAPSYFKVTDGEHVFKYNLSHKGTFSLDDWIGLNIQSVMIPSTEMLSHSRNFLALTNKYDMPFDGTQVDIIVNATLPEARSIPDYMQAILKQISNVVDGEVIYENETFYIIKKDGRKSDFSLEAEGLRKLALLWKLIRNGLLEKGTILLWDEPESNLNPELFQLVAQILLELERNGIQIFVATHSYNFAKYLEILRDKKEQVQFHSLYKGTSEVPKELKNTIGYTNNSDSAVYSVSAYSMEELQPNHIMMADEKLLDMIYDDEVGRK